MMGGQSFASNPQLPGDIRDVHPCEPHGPGLLCWLLMLAAVPSSAGMSADTFTYADLVHAWWTWSTWRCCRRLARRASSGRATIGPVALTRRRASMCNGTRTVTATSSFARRGTAGHGRDEGPGCIWRIWSATAEQGHVKIYLDGQAQPAVDLPFPGLFHGQDATV